MLLLFERVCFSWTFRSMKFWCKTSLILFKFKQIMQIRNSSKMRPQIFNFEISPKKQFSCDGIFFIESLSSYVMKNIKFCITKPTRKEWFQIRSIKQTSLTHPHRKSLPKYLGNYFWFVPEMRLSFFRKFYWLESILLVKFLKKVSWFLYCFQGSLSGFLN